MSDEKIFKDLEGILDWVKQQAKMDKSHQFQFKSQPDKNKIYLKKFLKFLNFEFDSDSDVCGQFSEILGGVQCAD